MKSKMPDAKHTDAGGKKAPSLKESYISDDELFSALSHTGALSDIPKYILMGDYASASSCWASYIAKRPDKPFPRCCLTEQLPDKELIYEADGIVAHRIRISGTRRTEFGNEINFISFVKEHRLEDLHSLSFLSYLSEAYKITKAPRYIEAFEKILCQWFDQHVKIRASSECHPIWNQTGCGIRTMSILDGYREMKPANNFSADFHKTVLKIILSSARWLYRSQEEYSTGSTAFDACAGLIAAAVYFPELEESAEWLERGIMRLTEKMAKEFSKDGGFSEMSDIYGIKVLDRLIFVRELLDQKKSREFSPKYFDKTLVFLAEYFVKTVTPAGTTNSFNDSAYMNLVPRIRKWADMFKRNDFLYLVREMLPESIAKKACKPQWEQSMNLPLSGRCIMRGGWDRNSPYMALEYSPHDEHSHCETSDYAVFFHGKPMVIDRGRGMSYDDPYHFFLRTSRLHSMVTLADENIDIKAKHARATAWHSGDKFDFLVLEHDGYRKRFEALVRRTILFVKPHYWIISDAALNPKKTVKATSYIHTFPVLFVEEDGSIHCRQAPGIAIAYPVADKMEFIKERAVANLTEFENEMQWTDYIGFRKSAKIKKGTTFMTVIRPYETVPPKIKVTRLDVLPSRGNGAIEAIAAEAFEISAPDGRDIFFVSHGKPATRRFGDVTTDAQTGIVRLSPSGEPLLLFAANATLFEYRGKRLHTSKKPATIEKTFSRPKK